MKKKLIKSLIKDSVEALAEAITESVEEVFEEEKKEKAISMEEKMFYAGWNATKIYPITFSAQEAYVNWKASQK
jgi:hypothetical protein